LLNSLRSGRESVAAAGEVAAPGVVAGLAGPVGVEPDHVDRGGTEGVLETDIRQAAVAVILDLFPNGVVPLEDRPRAVID
jgi:hypothetical protein